MGQFVCFLFNFRSISVSMEIEQKSNGNRTGIEQQWNGNGTEIQWKLRTANECTVQGAPPIIRLYTSREPLTQLPLSVFNFHSISFLFNFSPIPVQFLFDSYSIFVQFRFDFYSISVQFPFKFRSKSIQSLFN